MISCSTAPLLRYSRSRTCSGAASNASLRGGQQRGALAGCSRTLSCHTTHVMPAPDGNLPQLPWLLVHHRRWLNLKGHFERPRASVDHMQGEGDTPHWLGRLFALPGPRVEADVFVKSAARPSSSVRMLTGPIPPSSPQQHHTLLCAVERWRGYSHVDFNNSLVEISHAEGCRPVPLRLERLFEDGRVTLVALHTYRAEGIAGLSVSLNQTCC